MISEERVEKAVEFYRDNADRYGQLVGLCKALEQKRKVVHGQEFIRVGEIKVTVAEREALAYSSKGYREVVEEIQNAWADKTVLETQMTAAEHTIDVWRSQNSSRNKAHV